MRLFRFVLDDNTTWAVVGATLAEARAKAERYFPHEHVRVEESRDGGPWRLADAGCERCSCADVMRDLGTACDVSCGVTE